MNRYLDNTWFRHGVLLVAMAAGAVLTQFVPSYEEMAALQNRPVTPSAASRVRETASSGVRAIEVDERRLKVIRSMT
jgi:hypothetical protein